MGSSMASGAVLMSDPLPQPSYDFAGTPVVIAFRHVTPTSNTRPSHVNSPSCSHLRNRPAMSFVSKYPSCLMLEQMHKAIDVSSDHVPAYWSCVPWPIMSVHSNVPRRQNSYGTPKASPTASP